MTLISLQGGVMNLSKLNGQTFEKLFDDVDVKQFPFVKKSDINSSDVFTVKSCYLTKCNYGYQSVLILARDENGGIRVGFSGRDIFDNITSDKEIIDSIKNGSMNCRITSYENKKYNKRCYKPFFDCIPY